MVLIKFEKPFSRNEVITSSTVDNQANLHFRHQDLLRYESLE